jgi:hypothetical protein
MALTPGSENSGSQPQLKPLGPAWNPNAKHGIGTPGYIGGNPVSGAQSAHNAAIAHNFNPPFDKRIQNFPFLKGSDKTLQRGYMIEAIQNAAGLNFLYNPNEIILSHGSDATNNGLLPGNIRNPLDSGTYNVPLNSTVSASFLFDRTYETWDQSLANTPAGRYGVMVDVYALYYMLGMVPDPRALSGPITGPMLMTPVRMYIGQDNSKSNTLNFYGWVSSVGISYTHFTQQMTPNRCAIDLSLSILPLTPLVTAAIQTASSAAANIGTAAPAAAPPVAPPGG